MKFRDILAKEILCKNKKNKIFFKTEMAFFGRGNLQQIQPKKRLNSFCAYFLW